VGLNWATVTAAVTGAGSGIGRALSVELARRGAALGLSDIDRPGLETTADQCRRTSGGAAVVLLYDLDVTDRAAVLEHADRIVVDLGSLNMAVNNAGVAVAASVEETPFDDLDWLMGVNLGGVLNGTKAFLPHLIRSGNGHLINMSSVFGLVAPPYQSAYSASKFAVRGFTEALRQEMIAARVPVTVHSVHPGGVRTSIALHARYPRARGQPPADPAEQSAAFERIARTSPQAAAKSILRGVERDRGRILVGADSWVIEAGSRLLGPGYMPLLARAFRRRPAGH
jgi:NAD(P)-dependent dehydrogenase (short-subunit alcohol dehydrogenase family)